MNPPRKPGKKPANEVRRKNVLLEDLRKDFSAMGENQRRLRSEFQSVHAALEDVSQSFKLWTPIMESLRPVPNQLTDLRGELKSVKKDVTGLRNDVDSLTKTVETVERRLGHVERDLGDVRNDVKELKDSVGKRFEAVETRLGIS